MGKRFLSLNQLFRINGHLELTSTKICNRVRERWWSKRTSHSHYRYQCFLLFISIALNVFRLFTRRSHQVELLKYLMPVNRLVSCPSILGQQEAANKKLAISRIYVVLRLRMLWPFYPLKLLYVCYQKLCYFVLLVRTWLVKLGVLDLPFAISLYHLSIITYY